MGAYTKVGGHRGAAKSLSRHSSTRLCSRNFAGLSAYLTFSCELLVCSNEEMNTRYSSKKSSLLLDYCCVIWKLSAGILLTTTLCSRHFAGLSANLAFFRELLGCSNEGVFSMNTLKNFIITAPLLLRNLETLDGHSSNDQTRFQKLRKFVT